MALIPALAGGDKTIIQGQVLSMFTRPVSWERVSVLTEL